MDDRGNDLSLTLGISDALRDEMDRRGISETCVRQVIARAEATSDKLVDKSTGHIIAHLPVGKITCWVEYLPESGGYRVCRTYSHRMRIEEER